MKRTLIPAMLVGLLLLTFSCSKNLIRIACVGDSITEGYGLTNQSKTAYPVVLSNLLGPTYTVLNSGRSATTLQKKGNFPYWTCKEFTNVFVFRPDIIIIKLGSNDTKPENWHADAFTMDYQALIDTFNTIPSKPKIYLCLPVPAFKTVWGINDSTVTHGVIPIIKKLASDNHLEVIDLYTPMKSHSANFPDAIHPNEAGAKEMAGIVAKAIKK